MCVCHIDKIARKSFYVLLAQTNITISTHQYLSISFHFHRKEQLQTGIVTFDNDRQPDTCFLNCRRINVGDWESYKKQNLVLVTLVTVVVLIFQNLTTISRVSFGQNLGLAHLFDI